MSRPLRVPPDFGCKCFSGVAREFPGMAPSGGSSGGLGGCPVINGLIIPVLSSETGEPRRVPPATSNAPGAPPRSDFPGRLPFLA
jgi:hypothetical protein